MSSTKIVSFRDLDAWQAAMDLAVVAHEVAAQLPTEQRFELGSQVRRAATSVPSNVAEGYAHRSDRSYLRHVRIALGSLWELDTQLELARRLGLIGAPDLESPRAAIARTGQLL
jgi:four helix bundle protein